MTPEEQAAADAAAAAGQQGDGEGEGEAKAGSESPTPAEVLAELERTRIALGKANKEAETRRKAIAKYEADDAERKAADLSETEKLKAENEALRKANVAALEQSKQTMIKAAFVAAAAQAGVQHPDDVFLLADRSGVELDEDTGKITGVTEAVKALVDAGRVPMGTPRAPGLDGGAGGTGSGSGTRSVKLTATELEMAKVMQVTPEKYAANKAALAQRD